MSERESAWLRASTAVDDAALAERVEARLRARREANGALDDVLVGEMEALRAAMLPADDRASGGALAALSLGEADCDIVPRDYVIDWQQPLLGPINAQVRRVINGEVRRYLSAALEQQSFVNRQLLAAVQALAVENERLRARVDGDQPSTDWAADEADG